MLPVARTKNTRKSILLRQNLSIHFASDGVHEAIYIEAETIEEAEKIYHKTKKPISSVVGGTVSTAAPAAEPEEKEL